MEQPRTVRSGTKILLVNPNRYRDPPVPPIGLEHLSAHVKARGYECRMLDLCFVDDPTMVLNRELREYGPGVAGFSVRNVDSVLYPGTEYFLPAIRELLTLAGRDYGCLTVIGGAGVGAAPRALCDYLGADVAVEGPGEEVFARILENPEQFRGSRQVLRGEGMVSGSGRDLNGLDYRLYHDSGGVVGFRTHCGCSSACIYCLEAGTPVSFRNPADVVRELKTLTESGYLHFHLCDPEFNEDLPYCTSLLKMMVRENQGMKWALYMRPGTFSEEMFELLGRSGAYLVTLSVCSWKRDIDYWRNVKEMTGLGRDNGIRVVLDVMTGFPYETEDDLHILLDRVRWARTDQAMLNVNFRLYQNLPVTHLIRKDSNLTQYLSAPLKEPLLEPVFYNHVSHEMLIKGIGGDVLFGVSGETRGVNYQADERNVR